MFQINQNTFFFEYSVKGDRNRWMLLKRDQTKQGCWVGWAAQKVCVPQFNKSSLGRVAAAARFILPINWKPTPLASPRALFSCDSSDLVNMWRCCHTGHIYWTPHHHCVLSSVSQAVRARIQ